MRFASIRWIILLSAGLAMSACSHVTPMRSPVAGEVPIFDEQRLALTRDYCLVHYGIHSDKLETPLMIVVHYSAFATLDETLNCFMPTLISREDIKNGGAVNVSAHYLVDTNGEIIHLAPDDVICRHTIGFNHVALGIENVAADKDGLTDAQLTADSCLIHDLVHRYPSIEYLIGHHEYQDGALPHFALRRELDQSYKPTVKIDPGEEFMKKLREKLLVEYGLVLKR